MSKSGFKLIVEKFIPEKDERLIVNQTMNYLNTLRAQGIECWVNEEFPGPNNISHKQRRRASDILGIAKGRWLCFEMKTEKVYKYIMGHIDMLKAYTGPTKGYHRYKDQIQFVEMISRCGGIAMFACSPEQIKERLKQEGII